MELDENYHHASKRSCVGNGRPPSKIGHKELQHQDEDEEDGEEKKEGGGIAGINSVSNCLLPWQNHPSSRIYRVSRASGGKDRHSKVYTAKGLRDRRVRLSVSTAIQFYDLQDRLGYDQPSKAIEWLIKAAATAIDELPLLDNFLRLPSQHPADEEKPLEANPEDPNYKHQQQQHLSTKSGSSSNSETSKGSVLSLSRTESRVKKRERARERTAKDKEKKRDEGSDPAVASHHQRNLSSNLNNHSSFTELLTASGGNGSNGAIVPSVAATAVESNPNCIPKQISTADYFSQAGLFTQSQKNPQLSSGFSSPSHFGHSAALSMMPFNIAAAAPGDHQEMHQFSFLQDHLIPVSAVAATGDYNLNFSMSSSFAGFNRGTLQSNSPSQLPHHNHQHHHSNQVHLQQRLSTPIDGSSLPFFFGAAAAVANAAENPFPPGFDGRLQLCYNDGFRHSDLKEKRKS